MIAKFFRTESTFDDLLKPYRERADRIMVGMNVFLMVVCLAIAPIRDTYIDALLVGLPTLLLSYVLMRQRPGALLTRVYMGCAFMAFTGLIIHQTGGDIEGHFSAFGLVGVLLYYRDWRIILAATVAVYLHHLVLGYAQTLGVPIYVFDDNRFWLLFGVHVAYFLPFIGMMMFLSIWLRREGYEAQRVIDLAQRIVQGDLGNKVLTEQHDFKQPLIHSVLAMKNRLLDLLKVMPVPAVVVRVDQSRIVSVNESWVKTLGPVENFDSDFNLSPIWVEQGTWDLLIDKIEQQNTRLLGKEELPLKRADGRHVLCEVSLILHEDAEPVMAIMTVEDITERRKGEETMERLAFNDLLTGLPNRTRLQAVLGEAFNDWNDTQTPFTLAALDLDGFKPVNDTYGHDAGDEVLRAVASRFNSVKREGDVIARQGGDEFVLVIRNNGDLVKGIEITERFIKALDDLIHLRNLNVQVKVGSSAGVAVVDPDDHDVEAVLRRADQALYQAKEAGKNQVIGTQHVQESGSMAE